MYTQKTKQLNIMIVKKKKSSIAKSKKIIVLTRNMYISSLATRPKQTLNVLSQSYM